jgi:hypothetical protein
MAEYAVDRAVEAGAAARFQCQISPTPAAAAIAVGLDLQPQPVEQHRAPRYSPARRSMAARYAGTLADIEHAAQAAAKRADLDLVEAQLTIARRKVALLDKG